jgi:hypothetical protein
MGAVGQGLSDTDERIVDRFLARARRRYDAQTVRKLLVELYPVLASRLEIVTVDDRRIVVKRRRRG